MAITGIAAARAKMKRLPKEVQAAVRREMELMAAESVVLMRRAAPKLTGETAASIGWTWGAAPAGSIGVASVSSGGDRITIYAGNTATQVRNSRGVVFQKAKLTEFGTVAMAAQPYFYPIIRLMKGNATRRINAAARKAAREVWSR